MKKFISLLIAAILLVSVLPFSVADTATKELKVHFIDVGQGDSILIQAPDGKNMLVDGGAKSAGDKVVSFLKSKGVKKLNYVVATHPDAYIHKQKLPEMVEDEKIAQEIEDLLSNSKKKKKRIKDESEPVPPLVSGSRNQHRRDNGKAVQAIIQADFKCESDNSHRFFKSKKTGENYCETHHFVPMRLQKRFTVSLDVYSNLVSLCPVCHRALHHGHIDDKRAILEQLYNEREERLIASGIIIRFDEILDVYK